MSKVDDALAKIDELGTIGAMKWLGAELDNEICVLHNDRATRILQLDALLAHCPDGECIECAAIICPLDDPMHFHHDGCPSCSEHEAK